jgi:hypothetical protein
MKTAVIGRSWLLLVLHHRLSLKLADVVRDLLRVLGVAGGVCLL